MSSESLIVDPSILYGPERREWKDSVSRFAINPAYKPGKDLPKDQFLVKPPSNDPVVTYPTIAGEIGDHDSFQSKYQVPSIGLPKPQIDDANALALERNKRFQETFIGYQVNPFFDYSNLKDFLTMHTNNVGDAFSESNLQTTTRWIERNVLDYYASLWNIDWPHAGWKGAKGESYWGYCLTMGSSEGNLYGLWTARDYVTGKELIHEVPEQPDGVLSCVMVQAELKDRHKQAAVEIPVMFYSDDAHYSLIKTAVLEQIPTFYQVGTKLYPNECPLEGYSEWPYNVPSTDGPFGPGTVDIDKLTKLVTFFTGKGHPAIVSLNYGSTFKGAYDNVEKAGKSIMDYLITHQGGLYNEFYVNYEDQPPKKIERLKVWIHVDGALGASYMPFLEMALKHGKTTVDTLIYHSDHEKGKKALALPEFPVFDFRLPFVCSINTSGHKWMGAPWPCGVFMTRSKLVLTPPSNPDYIGSPDTTIAGSRNAFSPLILWNYISTHSFDGQVEAVLRCLSRLRYIYNELVKMEKTPGDLWVEMTPLALTLRFKKPNDTILTKYSIGTETVETATERRTYAHLFMMQSMTEWQIEQFLQDLRRDPAPFPPQETIILKKQRLKLGKLTSKRLVHWPLSGRGYH